jgi:hypothetical protein
MMPWIKCFEVACISDQNAKQATASNESESWTFGRARAQNSKAKLHYSSGLTIHFNAKSRESSRNFHHKTPNGKRVHIFPTGHSELPDENWFISAAGQRRVIILRVFVCTQLNTGFLKIPRRSEKNPYNAFNLFVHANGDLMQLSDKLLLVSDRDRDRNNIVQN